MKGLILKDFYMIKSYCKTIIFAAIVFFAVSLFNDENLFFLVYPWIFCGMIPVSLLAYDEKSHFMQYGTTLPCTKTQIVSAKYLVGIIVQMIVLVIVGVAQGIKMSISGNFQIDEYAVIMLTLLMVSTLVSAIPLPFIYKFGVEKGRIAYYVILGFVCAACVIFSGELTTYVFANGSIKVLFALVGIGGIVLYFLSWHLSVAFFKKREV